VDNKELFSVKLDYKSACALLFLAVLPNLLGMVNVSTPFGFKLHTFQIAIFLAAMLYGPVGGALSGGIGSAYSAIAMQNPCIIFGNIILGFFAGLFTRYGMHTVLSVLMAYGIQLPWLWLSDVYLAHMPVHAVNAVIIGLLISNTAWAAVAHISARALWKYV
jgi:uncharacterized membrane protein